ncbi:MAG TPA: MobF family relaxase [Mycobacteriales bacterium]
MISVAMLSGGAAAGSYYLDRAADCTARYYTGEREPAGVWCGSGAAAAGLTGEVTGAGRQVFGQLLAGRSPDGAQVGRPVLRPDGRGLLPVRPLVDAVRAQAAAHDLGLGAVFDGSASADRFAGLAVAVDASARRTAVTVDASEAAVVARAAGLDPVEVFRGDDGADRFGAALAHAGGKVDRRRAGIDVVVSPPKSVSVLHALGGEDVRREVGSAHDAAVREALAYLDKHAAHGMRGHQGDGQRAERIGTEGFVAAAFTHRTSRADDPQLHTHVVIANMLRGTDGRWSAVDSQAVFRQARTAGAVYQATLRGQLTCRLGVAWGPVHKSVAEIDGIPDEVCREFSTQHVRIEDECARSGSESRAARQRAAYRTRPGKSHRSPDQLRPGWEARVRDLGHDPARMIDGAIGQGVPPPPPDIDRLAARLLGPDGLTAHTTAFLRRDVTRALADALPAGTPIDTDSLEALTDQLLTHPGVVPLELPASNGERQWTTADLLATERAALTHATRQLSRRPIDAHRIADVVSGAHLTREQRVAAVNLAISPAAVQVLVGPAGSGKTTVLATASACWSADRRPVLGAALAATTAERLQTATGITSQSLARLLAAADRPDPTTGQPRGLPTGVVVVIDEASMVGTRQLARLLDHVQAAGGQSVLVGDPAQLPEVEAGGLFTALAQHTAATRVLAGNTRQRHDWERGALLALRAGAVDEAIEHYLAHDRIHLHRTPSRLADQIAADYQTSQAAHGPYGVVALASRRADVHRLNAAIRSRLHADGTLGPDTVTVQDADRRPMPLAAGDLVMVTRNDPRTGLLNGTRGHLTRVARQHLGLRTEDGRDLTVPTGWANRRLTHAYAMTVHKAQGLTTEQCLIYGTSALCQQAGYVALSRGREANHLYATTVIGLDADRGTDRPGFQLLTGPDPARVLDALADRLSHGPTHTLASRQLPPDDQLLRPLAEPPDRRTGISR